MNRTSYDAARGLTILLRDAADGRRIYVEVLGRGGLAASRVYLRDVARLDRPLPAPPIAQALGRAIHDFIHRRGPRALPNDRSMT
jgi:hypothetical protein